MARNVLLLGVVLVALALSLWGFGVVGPRADDVGGGPDADAPELAAVADGPAPPGPVAAAGLASGAPRVVARSKPPTVDGPRITGRVTDRAGKGIAQAHVFSAPDTAKKPFGADDVGTAGCPASDAITDAEGRFAVAVLPDAPFHAVIAEAAGFGPAVRQDVPTYADVTIVLAPGAAIAGTVTDAEGKAVVGAKVRLFTLLDLYRRELEATTHEGGAYRIEGIPELSGLALAKAAGVGTAIDVTSDGFAPLLVAFNAWDLEPGQEKRRDFILVRGASLRGRIVEAESGRPVPGARVVLWSAEGAALGAIRRSAMPNAYVQSPWACRLLGEARADEEGRYAFDHVPSQGYHPTLSGGWGRRGPTLGYVAAIAPHFVPSSEDVPVARDGATLEIDLRLRPSAIVSGRIVDADKKAVAGATIAAQAKGNDANAWFPPDLFKDVPVAVNWEGVGEDGRYRLAVPCDGARSVDAKLVGRFPSEAGYGWSPEGDGSVTVSVTAGATIDAPDLVLGAESSGAGGPGIALLVRTEHGKPVFGAVARESLFGTVARTDAEGRATIRPSARAGDRRQFPPETLLSVRAAGYATAWVPVASVAETGAAPTEVTLKPGRRLTGRVLRDDGTPVRNGRVAIGDGKRAASDAFAVRDRPVPQNTAPLEYGGADVSTEGRFEVENLPEGPYHVAAWPDAGRSGAMGLLADVPTGAPDLEIRLPPGAAPPVGGIEGRVVDATTGRPVAGVLVALQKPGAGAAGPAVPPAPAGIGGSAGVVGVVTSPGTFEMKDVPTGAWTLSVTAGGYCPVTRENLIVRVGETTQVDPIEMDRGVRVRGRLRAPDGVSMKEREAWFSEVSPPTAQARSVSVALESDGTFEGTGFTTGVWRVMAYQQGWRGQREPVFVAPIDRPLAIRDGEILATYDVTLVVTGHLNVQPSDARLPSAPWNRQTPPTEAEKRFGAEARLVVRDPHGNVVAEQKGLMQGHAGALQGRMLPPAKYVVRYEAPGDEPREETVSVTSGATTTVVVTAEGITIPPPPPKSSSSGPMACGAGKCG